MDKGQYITKGNDSMINVLTAISLVVALVQLTMLIIRGGKNQNFFQLMVFIMVITCNGGYLLLGVCDSVDTAIICNAITYVGGILMPYFIIMTMSDLCNVKLPKWLHVPLLLVSCMILYLVCTVGQNDLYYKEIDIIKVYGVTTIQKVSGPLHFTYRALLLTEVIICIAIFVRAYQLRKNFTKKTAFSMLAMMVVPATVYLLERTLHCPIELLPYSYVVVLGIYLSMASRMSMYDMSSSVASAMEKLDEYGYITFDLKKNLMNCNQMALNMFPELEKTEIDEKVEKTDSIFYQEIVRWIDLPDLGEYNEKKIKVGTRSIVCTVRKIHKGMRKKVIGYSVELVDNTKQENYIKLLNNYNDELEKQVEEKTAHISKMQESVITGIATMVESRDNSTGGHIKRTSECVKVFAEAISQAKRFRLSDAFLQNVIKAAPMHDLGKIAVDDVILRKPGKFTDEEYAIMKTHSEKGAKIVAEVLSGVQDERFVEIAVNVAHYHHEKWNGSGYPVGLQNLEIPVEARIMALADVFDALVSKRCYKEAFNYDKAFQIIEESLGSHFDPELGRLFIECRPKLEALYNSLPE